MSEKRTYWMQRLADELEMEYRGDDQWALHQLLEDFELFSRGRRRQISNMLYRRDPLLRTEVYIFDYYYRRGKGRSGDHRQTVFFVHSKFLALPQFEMKPENLLHKIGALLGFEDIDFEEFPEFSRRYRLKGPDESYIRASLNEKVLSFFSEEKNWYLEGINYYMIFYQKHKLLSPEEIRTFYQKGIQVFRLLAESGKGSVFQ